MQTDNRTMIQTLNIPSIDPFVVIVMLVLLLAGSAYACLVRYLRRRNRQHGYTAWLVVVGDLIVTAGFAMVAGVDAAVLLFLCLTAAGVPMIVEYIDDHLRQQESERRLDI